MRNRGILLGIAISFLLSGIVGAGGAGSIRLARPLERVAAGPAPLYLQALQHDVHPLHDAKVTVKGSGPEQMGFEVEAKLDPTYGESHVYRALLPLKAEGTWSVTVEAEHWVHFPPLTFSVEVLPCGSEVAAPGPVKPLGAGGAGHSHGEASAPPAVAPPPDAAAMVPPPRGMTGWVPGAGGALLSAGAGASLGFYLARRRPARA